MDDDRIGAAIRAIRIRQRRRQVDVARRAGLSRATVSRIERGRLDTLSVGSVRRVAIALDARIALDVRWRGGELSRLLGARHSAMHEAIARRFDTLPGWEAAPEASFSVYGERGVIDVLAYHAARRALLVIELKTELTDVQALLGAVDRYARLAPRPARERGWSADSVGLWLVLEDSSSNRRRVAAHRTVLAGRFPDGRRAIDRWLRDPLGPLAALTFLAYEHPESVGAGPRRVRRPR